MPKHKKICVLGLGYIGLPTASILATKGHKVLGVDIDEKLVANLRKGKLHVEEPDLDTIVHAALYSKNLVLGVKPEKADVFIIAVPTPIDEQKRADLRCVISAGESIVPYLQPGNLIILESTVPPGTTIDLLLPILEKSGFKAGSDFHLAFSPERVLPGQLVNELMANDRVIGGIDRESSLLAKEIYESFVTGKIYLSYASTAEMIKLMENTFRDVNVALANEFSIIAENLGINVWEAIELANKHPRVNILKPGPGVGGHCIAVDPWFIVEKEPQDSKLIRAAREINDKMPHRVVSLVLEIILRNDIAAKLAVLGITYKGNVNDVRESPANEIIHELSANNCNLNIYDPYVQFHPKYTNLSRSLEEAVKDTGAILILADHKVFGDIDPAKIGALMKNKVVIDTRNCIDHKLWQDHGFKTFVLGKNFSPKKESSSRQVI